MKVTKAVIPAAGYGTRFLPATKSLPKEMLPIIDTPTIQLIVDEAIESGIEDLIIIVSGNKNPIIDHFDKNLELEGILKSRNKNDLIKIINKPGGDLNIHFIRQKEQLGLGHAVLHAKTFIGDEPFALLLGDDLYVGEEKPAIKELIDSYNVSKSSVIGVLEVEDKDVNKYGICKPSSDQDIKDLIKLDGLVEKPDLKDAPSNLAIGGRYLLTPAIFKFLETQKKGAGNEIQLTDALFRLLEEEKVYARALKAKRYDIGSKLGYIDAILDFGLKRDDLKDEVKSLLESKI